ncbi:hypothetical protein BJX62DRAFT_241209 [Aspergillus germanicus]
MVSALYVRAVIFSLLTLPKTGPTLEYLPANILHLILSELPDLRGLEAAVQASPALYRAYSATRYGTLLSVLRNSHGGLAIESDAIAAVRSKRLCANKPSDRKAILTLLDCRRLESYKDPVNASEIIQLLRLHEVALWFVKDLGESTMARPEFVSKSA